MAYLSHLRLTNFRNLVELDLELSPGVSVYFGPNAQGKTTLLEAVYLLSIARSFRAKRRPILFGIAVVVGLAPFYNMPGDYYEMGSTITTRVATWVTGSAPVIAFEGIRSDDIFSLMSDLFNDPGEKGIEGAGSIAIAWLLVAVSLVVDVLLAFLTYFAGGLVGRLIVRSEVPKFVLPARK